jgi:hypothetical protein
MWIVLLDHSGSMGEPFRGSETFSGRFVTGKGGTKLEEARRSLLDRVRGIASDERVVVIAFTSAAKIVFDDKASQSDTLERALADLKATNGTSIAAALDAAVDLLTPLGRTASRVLLVSDCKSELAPAVESADRLIQFVHVIDVLLIDPDPETEAAARAMIRLGEVQAVVTPDELRTAVSTGDAASEQISHAISRAVEDANSSAAKGLAVGAKDRGEPVGSEVGFSLGYAPLLPISHTKPFIVVVHPAALKNEVHERLARMLAAETSDPRIAADGRTRLPKGAQIRIEPVLPHIYVNPARIEVLWNNRIEEFLFTMTAQSNAVNTYAIGSVNIWYGPAQIGCLPISVQISETATPVSVNIEARGLFNSVFPSYSRKDKSLVDHARGYYEALGIAVLQDTEALRSRAGVNWERALDGLILEADAFQLYWSHSAARSDQVEREWRFALTVGSLKQDRWIRPLRWMDDVPNLPTELAHLQMGWLPGFEDTERPQNPAVESIRCTVTPLVDCTPEQRKIVERECREAVHHVETATGLRCFPPPVLLVDEYIIQKEATHSHAGVDEDGIQRFAAAADLLNAMSLDIHTGFGRGKLNGTSSRRVDLSLSLDEVPRTNALKLAEWVFASVTDTILGINGFVLPREYGVTEGLPVQVAPPEIKPSARLAETVSKKRIESRNRTMFWYRDRSHLSDSAIEWLKKNGTGFDIQVLDKEVKVASDDHALQQFMEHALTPVVAEAIDNANPFRSGPFEEERPEIAIVAWLAPRYFENADRTDCAAFAESIGVPDWRSGLESFGSAAGYDISDPIELFERLLQSLQNAFDEVEVAYGPDSEFVTGYAITPESLDLLGNEQVYPQFHPRLTGPKTWTYMGGSIPALKRLFIHASEVFLKALATIDQNIGRATSHLADAHTYGVFIPAAEEVDRSFAAWAAMNGVPEALTFPGSDRILLCLEAIRRSSQRIDDADVRQVVRRLVLIHELLHATISSAVGPDETRQAALREARSVEESLAVWLELDAARDCPPMRNVVNEYISSGTYPEWPYAGAPAIESKFLRGGRSEIQSFVRQLIDNPEIVQRGFNDLVGSGSADHKNL